MTLRPTALLLTLSLFGVAPLAAQTQAADSAWARGDFAAARVGYEQALHDNPGSVRALYRLGILASWAGQLDSALALLADAREVEPADPDVRLAEARILGWASRNGPALSKYDSLLAEHPDNREAVLGRAQVLAWAGRLKEADAVYAGLMAQDSTDLEAITGRATVESWRGDLSGSAARYQAALTLNPEYVPALVGLAQVRQWQGRTDESRQYAERALTLAPDDRGARDAAAQVRALVRPRVEATLGWSHDSDRNTLWWQTLGTSLALGNGLRGFGSVTLAEASDPMRNGTRVGGEVGVSRDFGNASLTGAIGARTLSPDSGASRSLATWRASGSYRVSPSAGVGMGYAHYSFDETAFLLTRDLDVDEISADADAELRRDLTLGLGASVAWLSDDNRRRAAVASLTQRVAQRFTVGLWGRALGYDNPGTGYFAPDRFLVGEARGSYTYGWRRWETRVSGGLGVQQAGKGNDAQSEWHAEGRLVRRWGTINELWLSGGLSNSAESSTTGAFHYYTFSLGARLGL